MEAFLTQDAVGFGVVGHCRDTREEGVIGNTLFDPSCGVEQHLDPHIGRDVQGLLGSHFNCNHLPILQMVLGIMGARTDLEVCCLASSHIGHIVIGLEGQWGYQEFFAPFPDGQQLLKNMLAIVMCPNAAVARQDYNRLVRDHFGARKVLVALDLDSLVSFKGDNELASWPISHPMESHLTGDIDEDLSRVLAGYHGELLEAFGRLSRRCHHIVSIPK